jgi:membrane protein implicated in regulation of membrane protease activity
MHIMLDGGRNSDMIWWLWVLMGLGLLAFEMATPGGLFALFFGVAALLVAPLSALGVPGTAQWLGFTALSLVGLLTLRARLLRRMSRPVVAQRELVGEQAILLTDLPTDGVGKAELRGTTWTVRSAADLPLQAGQRCLVERVEGLTLWVDTE